MESHSNSLVPDAQDLTQLCDVTRDSVAQLGCGLQDIQAASLQKASLDDRPKADKPYPSASV